MTTTMTPLRRTLSNRLLSKLPPLQPCARAARFSAAADGEASAPAATAVPPAAASSESSPPIDAGSSIRKPISLWPGMYFSPVTNALWEARSKMFEEAGASGSAASPGSELVPRSPSRSRTSIFYKFSGDYVLREQYRNPWNKIRMGKLVEDLDALAGTICYKHCSSDDGTTRPLLLVTASVDRMVLKRPIRIDTDLQIAGAVTWVGRSSMEIQLEVTQSSHSKGISMGEYSEDLMRRAFELAFSTTYAFAGVAPWFVEVDHVDFLRPVDVGNFLRLKCCVLYTELDNPAEPLINVEVVAHVMRPELRSSEVSNKFYFTFTVRPEALNDGLRIRKVVPSTEEEAQRVLERMDAESCHTSS
ncbi:hypothetical protein NL676_019191 [Syzygium grande]|nr:hypothetical protein NL676_019191 [Syzygium grande]